MTPDPFSLREAGWSLGLLLHITYRRCLVRAGNEAREEGYFPTTVNKFSIHKVFRCSLVPQCMYMVCTQNPH